MSSKLTALTATTAPVSTDLVYVVTDPAGTPASHKCTIGNLLHSPGAIGNTAPNTGAFTTLSTTGALTLGGNVVLVSDAANTLALRNGANAGTLNVYGAYTDGSNYARVSLLTNPAYNTLFLEGAGTGLGAVALYIGTSSGMGDLYFRTAGTDRFYVTSAGHVLFNTDNASDIGAIGANRPKNGYFAATLKGSLTTNANATTGLAAGVLAALTNATIVITDGTGQAYRIPCII